MSKKDTEFDFSGVWKLDYKFEAFEGLQLGDSTEPSKGEVKLILEDELNENPDPKESQLNTINYINQNAKIIKSAMLSALPNYYEEVKGRYGIDSNNPHPNFPIIENGDAFSKHFTVNRVHILNAEKTNFSYCDLEGSCSWDREHGISFLLHKNKVLGIDQAGILEDSWLPYKDNGTYEMEQTKRKELKNRKPILYKPHPKYGTLKPKQLHENELYEYRLIERGYNDEFIDLFQKGLIRSDKNRYLTMTYLARAVQFNNFELCKFMLSLNTIDKSGAIQKATTIQMVELCTANGIDINEIGKHKQTLYNLTKMKLRGLKNQLKYAVEKDPSQVNETEAFFNFIVSKGATE